MHVKDGKVILSEKDFQSQVVSYAKTMGWLLFHAYDSRRSTQGFPDLVLLRGCRLLFAELKSDKGELSEAQKDWFAALAAVVSEAENVEQYIWRPGDWDDVVETLR